MRAHLARMSRYHRWAGRKLYEAAAELPAASLAAESKGLPFHSLQGTILHLVLADAIWLSRIAGVAAVPEGLPVPVTECGSLWQAQDPEAWTSNAGTFEEMRDMQERLCDRWDALIADCTEESLAAKFSYSNTRGDAMELVLGTVLAHVFNHGTHHRGQMSTALVAAGVKYPAMDLLYFADPGA